MSAIAESESRRERSIVYIVIGIAFVVLLIAALAYHHSAKVTAEANGKADQLIAALHQAGATTVPSKEAIVRVLGSDGGAVCAAPNAALSRATLLAQLTNGAGGPGLRPVIVDKEAVAGQALILQVYCPDQLAEFQTFVNGLKTAGVAGG